ncbi:hypothetical protein FRC01_006997, partial [Tulasnella sp. 417]
SGDEPSRRQRNMADGYLLNFLLHGSSVYHPSGSGFSVIVLAETGEMVEGSSYTTLSYNLLDITTNGLPRAVPDHLAPSTLPVIAHVQLGVNADRETSVASDRREDTNSTESVDDPIITNAESNIDTQAPGTVTIGLDAAIQAAPLAPTLAAPANPHVVGLNHTSQPLPSQQREAARQDVRSGLLLWPQQARQRHVPPTGVNAWSHASQGGIAAENYTEEEVQPQGAPKRIKRRGGKKNALWKRKCRERRDHHEHNPGAGPSGLH